MDIVLGILSGAISIGVILVFGVKYILLPYLEKKLLIATTTLLGEVLQTKAEIIAVARMFDGHLLNAQTEHDRLWAEIERIQA